ncbi:unnamed protein product, partial [Symbiodinium microadriaticum]
VLSPQPPAEKEREDGSQQDILEHCRDTAKLVKQLASVLKGLEADVESLRRENHSLRKTVLAAVPSGQNHDESSRGGADPDDHDVTVVASSMAIAAPHANPLQTRATPPPSARLAQPPAQERG